MAKSLSERIATRSLKKKPSRSAQNRAAFLALREEIKKALDDGWPVKSIWETLVEEGKISFSYQAFRGYTNRLILSADHQPEKPSTPKEEQNKQAEKTASVEASKKKPTISKGFSYNPIANKEELF
jgi:hypothetical protein